VEYVQTSFKKSLLSHDKVLFVYSHPSAFPPSQKDTGYFFLHEIPI